MLSGEIIADEARPLTFAELASLATNDDLIEKLRQTSPGISREAVQAVVNKLIGDAIEQRDIYRKQLPTAEAFVLRAKGACSDIHLNANKAGTWKKNPHFDMTAVEKQRAEVSASVDRLRRSQEETAKREAENRKIDEERRLEEYARRWLLPEGVTRQEQQKLEAAIGAARRKEAQGELLTPHDAKLLKAEKEKAAIREETRIFWEQRQASAAQAAPTPASIASDLKAHIADRQRTERT